MTKTLFLAMMTVLLSTAVSADDGSVVNPFGFYLGGGLTVPAAPASFRSDHNTGANVYTALSYALSPFTEVLGRLELSTVTLDATTPDGSHIELTGGGLDMLIVGADVKFSTRRPAAPLRPFASVGGGITRISQANIMTELAFEQYAWLITDSQTKPYFAIGVGLDFKPMSNTTMFVLARYFSVARSTDNKVFIPVTLGFRF